MILPLGVRLGLVARVLRSMQRHKYLETRFVTAQPALRAGVDEAIPWRHSLDVRISDVQVFDSVKIAAGLLPAACLQIENCGSTHRAEERFGRFTVVRTRCSGILG